MEAAVIIIGAFASLIVCAVSVIVFLMFVGVPSGSSGLLEKLLFISTIFAPIFNIALCYFALTASSVTIICLCGIPALVFASFVLLCCAIELAGHFAVGILMLLPTIALFVLALVQ